MWKAALRTLRALSPSLLLFTASACSTVTSVHPLGQPPADQSVASIAGLEGVWTIPDMGPVFVKVLSGGRLKVATVRWEDDEFKLNAGEALLTSNGGALFVNLPGPEKEPKEYTILRIASLDDDDADAPYRVIFGPDADAFAAAVTNGQLEGEVKRGDSPPRVKITAEKAVLDEFVRGDRLRLLFNIDDPLVITRVAGLDLIRFVDPP